MALSEDEVEDVPQFVTNYYFEDDKAEPISFSVLPVCWNPSESVPGFGKQIYVRGIADAGLHNLYKPVKAWKLDISGKKAEISVLLKDNYWIKLQKPRNSYEEFIRTVLVTANFLHLVKRNTELPGKDLWDKLSKIFSSFEEKPSQYDLADHKTLIQKAVECDESLRKSKYLMALLEKNLHKKYKDLENGTSKGRNIINDCEVDDLDGDGYVDDEAADEEDEDDDDCCDSVCFICDEGGSLLCCEGTCMRSFHATPRAAEEAGSGCSSLGLSERQVQALEKFKCQNCEFKLHQCYACGRLGSSDKESEPEVFQCVNATCGYFYHPCCVAKKLHRDNEDGAKELQKNISAGEPFTCPLHVCFVCGQAENNSVSDLRMAVCRRCPKAYHQKCLPREISFEDKDDEGIFQRAWDDLLVDHILIYCLDHEILEDLGTPLRNHIKFPGDEKKRKEPTTQQMKKKALNSEKPIVKNKLSRQGSALEAKKLPLRAHPADMTDNKSFKSKGTEASRNMCAIKKIVSEKVEREELDLACCKSDKLDVVESSKILRPAASNLVPELDSDSETRILDLMKEGSSGITLDDVLMKHEKLICSRVYKQKMDISNITLGKVDGFCKAVRAASSKIAEGGSVEDVKAICEPKILDQVAKWKSRLRVYLSPFLYGMRYTSFGRHFTKVDKLKEIVDSIHWYVNNNDTIVDFCCGANDFSWLLKQKLECVGKTCHYKNYDLFRPKNDFSFEKRDWMTVHPKELPTGSQLIMGLNPPFGVRAGLANQFINKALEFKPKLLILIVPLETERLDKKKTPYDLVWEDRDKLSGKSFYLPGSVDVNDKQMEDWNVVAPVLYLWSRPDWTTKHKAIAKEHDHPSGRETECNQNQLNRDLSMNKLETAAVTKADDVFALADRPERLKKRAARRKQTAPKDHSRSSQEITKTDGDARKRRHSEKMHVKEFVESSQEYKRRRSSPLDPHHGRHRQVSAGPTNVEISDAGQMQFESTSAGDGRYSSERRPFRYEGYPEPPSNLVDMRDPAHDLLKQHIAYRGRDRGLEISGGYYHDRAGNCDPQADYVPHVSALPPGYRSPFPGEPGYMRQPGGYDANPLYGEPGQGFRTPAFSSGPAYGRTTGMSAIDKYHPSRLDELNRSRMGAYEADIGPPSQVGGYSHPAPRPAYPGVPMGFATGPIQPSHHHHHHGPIGGWVNE